MVELKPHRVIAEFKDAGAYIKPGGLWTPPTVQAAEKLIAAGCITPQKNKATEQSQIEPFGQSEAVATEQPRTRRGRGRPKKVMSDDR